MKKKKKLFLTNDIKFYDQFLKTISKLPQATFNLIVKCTLLPKAYYTINDYGNDKDAWKETAQVPPDD